MKVGVIDYKAGNLRSVQLALEHLSIDYAVTDDPEALRKMDKLLFPGVGEARSAMEFLTSSHLAEGILDFVKSGKPLLGICLGCQILMASSEERNTACLGVFPGKVRRFPGGTGLKVPHMGWNEVYHRNRHRVFEGIPDGASFYFVHSYYVAPGKRELEIADTEYGVPFTSGVAEGNVIAFQFHPEKSGKHGLELLSNFFRLRGF